MQATQIATTKDALEELLRIELAAAETYARAVEHTGNHDYAPELVELEREHGSAVFSVRNLLARLHDRAKVGRDGGAVGTAAKAVELVAAIFGPDATVRALRAGEQTLINYMTRVADDRDIAAEARTLVGTTLLPAARKRVTRLDRMLTN